MSSIDAYQILNESLLAMLLGGMGQGIRAAAGLQKTHAEARNRDIAFNTVFDKSTFWFSLFIGALAGLTTYLGLKYAGTTDGVLDWKSGKLVMGLVAAGYSGADFIESFAKKYLP
jgi:hypothetical protein